MLIILYQLYLNKGGKKKIMQVDVYCIVSS